MKTIDTRDLYERKCEIESLRDAVTTAREELEEKKGILAALEETPEDEASEAALEIASEEVTDAESNLEAAESDFGDDEKEELDELETLENEISDFRHGETMIPENDFEDYARQLAEDIGAIPDDAQWPCTCIDWEWAARELAMDYSMVEYQGESYYVRS
jgi:antirestriction protein